MLKVTQKEKLIKLLKRRWVSSYQMQQAVMSGSADRTMRRIRENPPEGYIVESRVKKVPVGYGRCLEYRLCEVNR